MGKRANGDGTFRKRADGRWEARVAMQVGHRLVRRSVYGQTKHECRRLLSATIRQLNNGVIDGDDRVTVADFLTQWINAVGTSLRPKTLQHYRYAVDRLAEDIGRIKLQKLTPQDVDRMLKRRADQGLGLRSVAHLRSVLRNALNQGIRWQMIERNVAELSIPPKIPASNATPITPEEAAQILDAVRDTSFDGIITVCLSLGLRLGEALGLTWDCIDFERGELRVRRALEYVDKTYRLTEPKTKNSRRALPLPVVAARALYRSRQRQDNDREAAGARWHPTIPDLVFTTTTGAPIHPTTITNSFRKLLAERGLKHRTVHELRHGCATLLLAQGADIKTVSSILGHSQISLTANTYTEVLPSLSREAIAAVDRVLDAEQPGTQTDIQDLWTLLGSALGSTHQTEQLDLPTIFVKPSGALEISRKPTGRLELPASCLRKDWTTLVEGDGWRLQVRQRSDASK